MGWTFYYKPKGVKAVDSIKNGCGAEWLEKHFVAASATREAVFIVAKFHEPESDVYEPDADGTVRVILVYKIKSVPNASDGYNFGYKDMSETMGPYGCPAPASIIALASPLRDKIGPEPEYSSLRSARAYREGSLQYKAVKAVKRSLKIGQRVKLPKPLSFSGIELDEFTVTKCRVRGRKGMSTVFRSVKNGGLYALRAADLAEAIISEGASA